MAVTKNTVVQRIAESNGFSKNQAYEITESLLEVIKGSLASGEDVLVSGFGKFQVKEKSPRKGRNPATGGDMLLRGRKIVTFKCSSKLREKINHQI